MTPVPLRGAVGFGVGGIVLGVIRVQFPHVVAEFVFVLCPIPLVGLGISRLVIHS